MEGFRPQARTDLGEPWGQHPILRAEFERYRPMRCWSGPDAFLARVTSPDRWSLVGLGEPAAVAALLTQVLIAGELVPDESLAVVSLTRGGYALLSKELREDLGVPHASHWDWMYTTTPPARHDLKNRVLELDLNAERSEMAALQALALPNSFTSLDQPDTRWFGWRDDQGELRCMAAASYSNFDVHLGSIATHPKFRRRGLGTALTAHLTRLGLAATGQVSLGLYADNHSARRMYERLGFTLIQRWESRRPQPARS